MALDQEQEMSFLEHLEALRWHLIRSFIAIGVLAIAAFVSNDFVFGQLILGPTRLDFWTYSKICELGHLLGKPEVLCIEELPFIIQSRKVTGQFTMHLSSSFVVGFIAAFPYVFWEIWRFVSPGLLRNERRAASGAVFFVTILFLSGVCFGYFMVGPLSINFLSNYSVDPSILNEWDITSYVSTLSTIVLTCGIMFQLPMAIYWMSKAGIVTSAFLKQYWRHAFILILLISAILTPPDLVSQVLVAFPLYFLYYLSIKIAAGVERRKRKRALAAMQKMS